jgi:tripartite-type tricarboxylate transporter receptor subunit TctC
MTTKLRVARYALFSVIFCLAVGNVFAQEYPDKPVRFIVGYPPGSANDTLARILGQKLTELWGQQVVVDMAICHQQAAV